MVQKIALEEHVLTPGMIDYWRPTMTTVPPALTADLFKKLTDFGDHRLEEMDKSGIARAILSVAGPGVQAERDAAVATNKAREANDDLAVEIQKHPDRYTGFAHIAVQDPKGAADELERCMRDLKFAGAMINGHTNGLYLDHPSLAPFWERAEALGALIYLHPGDPVTQLSVLDGYPALQRPMWGWGVETGSHALRMVVSGLFDRYPKARLGLGHLGETLPFLLWRFDSRAQFQGLSLKKPPSQYIRENIWVTISGMLSAEPMKCSVDALGRDRVLFGADYPFEDMSEAGHFLDTVEIEELLREDIGYNNAAKLLGL